jgi:hypothetical protein
MVVPPDAAKGLSVSAKVEPGADGGIDLAKSTGVKWAVPLGTQTYGNPVVAGGRVYVGTNNDRPRDPRRPSDRAVLLCLDEQTGALLWQLASPKLPGGKVVDFEGVGLCASPAVEGERVYVLTNRCEVLCLDARGMANGNDGPFLDEAKYLTPHGAEPIETGPADADILWRYDLYNELGVFPYQQASGSVLLVGDRLYTTTSNGVDWTAAHHPRPTRRRSSASTSTRQAPRRGAVGHQRPDVQVQLVVARVRRGERPRAGVLRRGRRVLLRVRRRAVDGVLREAWRFDCNPPQYKVNPKTNKPLKYGSSKGYSEICATPVFHGGKVFVATGQDPEAGDGVGNLSCIDAAKAGDVTQSGKVWSYDGIGRSLSTVSVAGGLVYAADYAGQVHCLDEKTGEAKWVHDTEGRVWGSTLVADGKVYVGSEERVLTILKAGPPTSRRRDRARRPDLLDAGRRQRRDVRRDGPNAVRARRREGVSHDMLRFTVSLPLLALALVAAARAPADGPVTALLERLCQLSRPESCRRANSSRWRGTSK